MDALKAKIQEFLDILSKTFRRLKRKGLVAYSRITKKKDDNSLHVESEEKKYSNDFLASTKAKVEELVTIIKENLPASLKNKFSETAETQTIKTDGQDPNTDGAAPSKNKRKKLLIVGVIVGFIVVCIPTPKETTDTNQGSSSESSSEESSAYEMTDESSAYELTEDQTSDSSYQEPTYEEEAVTDNSYQEPTYPEETYDSNSVDPNADKSLASEQGQEATYQEETVTDNTYQDSSSTTSPSTDTSLASQDMETTPQEEVIPEVPPSEEIVTDTTTTNEYEDVAPSEPTVVDQSVDASTEVLATEEPVDVESFVAAPSTEEPPIKETPSEPTVNYGNTNTTSNLDNTLPVNNRRPNINYPYVSPPDYERYGRGLVYNCKGQHWACVDKKAYFDCRNNERWGRHNGQKVECSVRNVYATNDDCQIVQRYNIDRMISNDFCE